MSIDVMSLIIFLAGAFILIYGIFFAPTEEEEKMIDNSMDFSSMERILSGLENKLGDADKMMGELDKFSKYVTNEMQDKYKEMMFLYQMIDDKEKAVKKEAKETNDQKVKNELAQAEIKKDKEEREEAYRREQKKNAVNSFYNNAGLNKSAESKAEAKAPMMVAKSSFNEVVYMYESGKSVEEIAKALGKGKGEIRLMLDLMGEEAKGE